MMGQAICALSCWFVEPEVGFEPTTFRLRDGCSASIWTAPDGYKRIVWMIIGMIKAHPTESDDRASNSKARRSSTSPIAGVLHV